MKDNPIIKEMTEEIVKICNPLQIFLVSGKNNSNKYESHSDLETEILLKTDCPVPCDVIVYTIRDWNACVNDDCTFAYRIDNEGNLLYEQTQ